MLTPNPKVSNGMMITPPPKPVSEPNKPAKKAPTKTISVKTNTVMFTNIRDLLALKETNDQLNTI